MCNDTTSRQRQTLQRGRNIISIIYIYIYIHTYVVIHTFTCLVSQNVYGWAAAPPPRPPSPRPGTTSYGDLYEEFTRLAETILAQNGLDYLNTA